MGKIIIISPSKEFTELAKDAIKEKDCKIYTPDQDRDFSFEETIHIAKREEENGAEVIVTRGGHATLFKKILQIPVVEVKMSVLDILRTLESLKHHYTRIGLVGVKNIICDYQELDNYINIQIYPIFSYQTDLDLQIRKALTDQVEFIIGDGMSVDYAKTFGLPGIKLMPSPQSIHDAIEAAENIVLARRKERTNNEQFRMVLESSQDGFLILSENHHILLVNHCAAKLLKKGKQEFINQPIEKILSDIPYFLTVLQAKEEFDGEIIWLKESVVSVSKKPIRASDNRDGYVITLQDITRIQHLEQQIRKKLNKNGFLAKFTIDDIVSCSLKMKQIEKKVRQFSGTDSTVLILGETGTGKELIAQSIHNLSPRKNCPFVPINCGALPPNLLESELFGYEAGAFTGAQKSGKEGLFELAHTGTIFLDEIGEIPLELQSRLLRVIQAKEVMRIGGNSIIPVDVRIIAATHKDLQNEVKTGTFRKDLFYRLNILSITLPPVRDRREDIALLLDTLLARISMRYQCKKPELSTYFIQFLEQYSWPGNVRQMENIAEKIVVLAMADIPSSEIFGEIEEQLHSLETVPMDGTEHVSSFFRTIADKTLDQIEKQLIQYNLERFAGNKELVAKKLGISRATLWRKLREIQ